MDRRKTIGLLKPSPTPKWSHGGRWPSQPTVYTTNVWMYWDGGMMRDEAYIYAKVDEEVADGIEVDDVRRHLGDDGLSFTC